MAGTRICDVCQEEVPAKGIGGHKRGHRSKSSDVIATRDPKNPNTIVLNRWPTSDEEKATVRQQIEGI